MPCTFHPVAHTGHSHVIHDWHKAHSYDRFAMVWHGGHLYVALEPSGPYFGGAQHTDNREFWARISGDDILLSDALDGDRTAADNVGASEWALAQVNAKAETAENKAENAQNAADNAQREAETAREAADAADAKAENAQTTADSARSEAENARDAAQNAQNTADTAQSAAATADAKADAAQEAAYAAREAVAALETTVLSSRYELCEFYTFRGPELPEGFYPRTGGVIANCASRHPEAWRKLLDTPEGQAMCLSETAWQAMNKAAFATLADGSKVGWNGIGGVPFYAPDPATGALRLPDTRGMYAEDAGFDALGVGGVHGDGIRKITGAFGQALNRSAIQSVEGAFYPRDAAISWTAPASSNGVQVSNWFVFDSSRVVPTAAKNQPRAWGALACVYLGAPE